MKKNYLSISLIIIVLNLTFAFSQEPSRIILNLTEKPATSIAVTWRTKEKVKNAVVEYTEATNWDDFAKNVDTVNATSDTFRILTKGLVYHHSAVIKDLNPETIYVYRVGNGKDWSEWNQFTTASAETKPCEFVYLGDPQNGIFEHCSRVFRQAFQTAPKADFWLCTGDIVTCPRDYLWNELFDAAGFIFRVTPSIMVPGNHDYLFTRLDNKYVLAKNVNRIFNVHVTNPQNGLPIPKLQETSYYVDYQGVRIVMMDTNIKRKEQAEWLDELLMDNPNNWTIVCFHHPVYSTGLKRDDPEMQEVFQPVFDKHKVDLVLQGHDHTYGRTYKIRNGETTYGNGTTYVVSVCGPKMYKINPNYKDIMAKMGGDTQLYQVISVDQNKLSFKAYTITGELFDSFELKK